MGSHFAKGLRVWGIEHEVLVEHLDEGVHQKEAPPK